MPWRLRDCRTVKPASTCELPLSNMVLAASAVYNESKCNVREVALFGQIPSSVSTWHQRVGVHLYNGVRSV